MWRLFTSLILELDLCKLHCKCLQLNVAVCRQPTHHKLLTIHVHSRIRLSEGRWAAERPTSIWKISNCGFLPAWHPGPEESFAALQLAQIIVRHQTTFLHSAVILYIYQYITTAGGEKLKFRIFSQKQRASHVCSICVVSLWYQLERITAPSLPATQHATATCCEVWRGFAFMSLAQTHLSEAWNSNERTPREREGIITGYLIEEIGWERTKEVEQWQGDK